MTCRNCGYSRGDHSDSILAMEEPEHPRDGYSSSLRDCRGYAPKEEPQSASKSWPLPSADAIAIYYGSREGVHPDEILKEVCRDVLGLRPSQEKKLART